MSVRALLWLLGFFGGAFLAVTYHPVYGVYIYFLDYYSHPPLRWWGQGLPDLRWSLMAAMVLMAAYNMRRSVLTYDLKVFDFPQTKWFAVFVIYAWIITLSPLAVWKDFSWEMAISLTKFYVLYCLLIKTANDPKHFRILLMVQLFGLMEWGWSAFENPKREAGRLMGVGGADTLNDNFTAAHLVALLPLLAVGLLAGKRWEKIACFIMSPFLMNLFILCNSRGSFLALIAMSGLALWITRGVIRWKIIGAMALGGILFLQLVDPVFFERQGTTAEYEDDGSAMERVEAWDGALYLLRDHPLGAGGGAFKALSPQYIIEIVRNHDGEKRGVHNTLFQLTSDWGIPGLIMGLDHGIGHLFSTSPKKM
ncbi:O-antigen ligase family protein, partial [Candidatus Entotheonella palauensis]|uniref:O-antigen ligase family protein n=1 Tax=Candidatus Entotheonella palauensis TaxID=93172 RepID=UPI0015C4512E